MSAAAETIPPQVQESKGAIALLGEIDAIVARANALQVTDAGEYAIAVGVCQNIKAHLDRQEAERLAITRPMDAAKSAVLEFFRKKAGPLNVVDKIVRDKLKTYDAQQRKLADVRRREAEAQARREREAIERKAREEKEKADAKARAEREEADRKRAEAEKARRDAEAAEAAGDARAAKEASAAAAKLDQAAAKAENRAESVILKAAEKVEVLENHAAAIVAPVVMEERPKVDGNVRRTVWKYRIKDPAKVARLYLMLDEQKIGALVRNMKKDAEQLVGPGAIEVYEEEDLTIRRARS